MCTESSFDRGSGQENESKRNPETSVGGESGGTEGVSDSHFPDGCQLNCKLELECSE